MVVDDGNAVRFEVAGPAGRFQFLQGEEQVGLALPDYRRPDLLGETHVADHAAAALRHAYGICFFNIVAGGDGRFAYDIAGQDNSLTSRAGNQ